MLANDRCMPNRRFVVRPKFGLTLLELMIATLLATMAMGACVGMLKLLERQRKESQAVGSDSWRSGVVDMFERDLIGARQIAFSKNRLIMLGHELDDQFSRHVPTETTLYLEPNTSNNTFWMIRGTRGLGSSNTDSSLICGNITRWEVERIDDLGVRQPISRDLSPAPRRLSFRIWFRGARQQEYAEQWLFVAN